MQIPASLQANRTLARNVAANLLYASFLAFGLSLVSGEVVLPLFVSNLSDNPVWIGLIMSISFAGWLLPQVFTAPLVARQARIKKPLLVALFFAARLPLLLLGPAVALLVGGSAGSMLLVFFLLLAWNSFGTGLTAVGSQELYARVIPVAMRGRLTGISGAVGLVLALLGTVFNRWVLANQGFPTAYALLFTAAGISALIAWLWLFLIEEDFTAKDAKSAKEEIPFKNSLRTSRSLRLTSFLNDYLGFFRTLPALIRADRNFAWFLASTAVLYLGGMSGSFLAVAAKDRWNLPEAFIVTFPIAMYIGQGLGSLACGFLADRTGYKLVKIIENVANVVLLFIAIFASAPWLFYPIFALKGLSIAADGLGNMISLEFSSPELRPAYVGIYNTASGIVFIFSPLLAGWLAALLGYNGLFWITAIITAIGVAMLIFLVREPRRRL